MPYWMICTLAVIGAISVIKWLYRYYIYLFVDDGSAAIEEARVAQLPQLWEMRIRGEITLDQYVERLKAAYNP